MAKRRQTTGRPRKDRAGGEGAENSSFWDNLLGNPTNRAEREEAVNRLIQRSIMVVVILVAVIIAAGLIYEFLVIPQLTIATVNGDRITVSQFRNRLAFEQEWDAQQYNILASQIQQQAQLYGIDPQQLAQQNPQFTKLQNELQFPDLIGERVVNDMVDEALIQQEFDARGLTLSEVNIESAKEDFFGFDPTANALIGTPATETPIPTITATPFVSPTPTLVPTLTLTPSLTPSPTLDPEATVEATSEVTDVPEVTELPTLPPSPTPSQQDRIDSYNESVDLFEQNLKSSELNNVSQAQIEDFWKRQAIRKTLADDMFGDLGMATFANVRHILVDTEDEANQIIEALNTGESFADLAKSRSTDTNSSVQGGELGWQPIDIYVPAFADAIRSADIGAIVGPVKSDFGYHILQVRAIEERELNDTQRQQVRSALFSRWLDAKHKEAEDAGEININDSWPDYLP